MTGGPPRTTQITASRGIDRDPAFSPDWTYIAYGSDRSGTFEIYVKSLAPGGREIQVTDDGQQNSQPAWSADGRQIVYHSRNRGGLWMIPAFGGVAKQVTEFGSNPAWSPKGDIIAFQSSSPSYESSTIWVVEVKGGSARQLTRGGTLVGTNTTPAVGHVAPCWSPDGNWIAFHTVATSSEIWSINVRGSELNPLARLGATRPKTYPTYSPDGRAVYFTMGGNTLWKVPIDSKGKAQKEPILVADLGGVTITDLTISPDGSRLAYSAQSHSRNLSTVLVVPNSGDPRGQVSSLTSDANGGNTQPAFSPDGKQIAFRKFVRGPAAGSEIWLMDAQGRNQRQLTYIPNYAVLQPEWLSSGELIAFRSNIQGHYSLWSIPSQGGKETLLFDLGRDIEYARVSPDGKQVAFHQLDNEVVNIWIAAVGGAPRQLTFERELMAYPCWSPDGQWLALQGQRGSDTHIFIMPSSGGKPEQLTFEKGQSAPHSWSPDSDKIAFVGYRNGKSNVWWVSRSTREQKRVTDVAPTNLSVQTPAWSPIGDRIVSGIVETSGNIWMMELKPR